jgi:Ca2+-binding RTX toxin-like protein
MPAHRQGRIEVIALGDTQVITTGAGADVIDAGAGDDTVIAGGGNDVIRGGLGVDSITGDTGDNVYVVVGSLDATDNAKYSNFNGSVVVNGVPIDVSKVVSLAELTTSKMEDDVQSGETINGFGIGDRIVVFGTTDLTKINGGGPIPADIIVNSTVTVDFSQLVTGSTQIAGGLIAGMDTLSKLIILNVPSNGVVNLAQFSFADIETVVLEAAAGQTLENTQVVFSEEFLAVMPAPQVFVKLVGGAEIAAVPGMNIGSVYDDGNFQMAGDGGEQLDGTPEDDVLIGGAGNDIINGVGGNDLIEGRAGADVIDAGSGDDVIVNFEGFDSVQGGDGNDTLQLTKTSSTLALTPDSALQGIEVISASGAAQGVTIDIFRQTEDFQIEGSVFNDTIIAFSGNDTINGGAGADTILGGAGNDTVIVEVAATGFEADSINLGLEKDDKAVFSGAGLTGKEVLVSFVSGAVGSGVTDTVNLQLQDAGANGAMGTVTGDTATLDDEGVVLSGAKFNVIGLSNGALDTANQNRGVFDEVVLGTNANDVDDFSLEAEDYYVNAGAGNDSITTGSGKDFLVGGEGDDTLNAGAGNDSLLGGAGDDTIDGGEGNDTITGGAGADTILGGAGNDTVTLEVAATGFEADSINLGLEKDDKAVFSGAGLTGKEVLVSFVSGAVGSGVANAVNLQLQDAGVNGAVGTVTGGTATLDDEGVVLSGAKFNVIGLSNGALDTANQNRGVFDEVVLGTNANDVDDFSLEAEDYYVNAGAGNDSITTGSGKDFLVGGEGDDTLNAGAGNDSLLGGAGDDNIDGGEGNDTINGGAGADTILGGAGNDTVIVEVAATGFEADSINLGLEKDDKAVFSGAGLTGKEVLVSFVSGAVGSGVTDTVNLQLQDAGANGAMGTVTGDTATLDDEGVVLSGAKFNVIGLSNGALDTANQNRGVFDEVVLGTNANDVDDFSLEAEDYYVNAGAGNDSITTGSGKDFLVGGEGDDTLNAGAGNDSLLGGAGDDNIDGGEGNDAITGGAGNDAINGGLGTDTVSYANAVSVTANATGFVVDAGAEGMDTLNGVEKLVFTVSDGMGGMIAKTFLLVGNGGYATIQAAVDAAAEGDTIVLADETFIGNVLVNKGVTIISANNAGKSGTDAMRTLESVIDGELMITTTSKVVIDGVTFLNNDEYTLDINDNYVAVKVLAHASAASGGHVITNSIFLRDPVDPMGFNPTAFAGSNFQPTHRAVELAKVGAGAAVVVSDNLFTGTNPYFYAGDNWRTGVYSNGGEGSTSIADNTFENVRGALNLDDFGTTVSVTGNNFESAGSAIALGGVPTVATNLTSISGNTFGRVDTDFNGQNLSAAQPVVLDIGAFGGPAIGMIDIAGTLIPEPFTALTGAGNDVVTGSSGNDIITTNAGNDAITGGAGNDAINGGLGTDTVSYANAVSVTANATGFVVDAGAEGMDTLNGVEKLVFTVSDGMGGMIAKTFLLVGNGGYATIQAAVDAAAEGDTIVLADETFIGNVLVNKGVTIISANNAGKSGTDAMRTLESVIDGELMITTTSKVVIDGVTFLNNDEYTLDINDNYVAVKVLAHASAASGGHVITNSIFLRDPVDPMGFNPTAFAGSNFQPTHRAVELAKVGAGAAVVVSDNLFTGTNPYFYAGDNWRTGVYSNGGEGSTSIADNTFENVRGALNLDDFGTTVSVTGNNFESAGSAIALGGVPTVATNLTSISGNTFGRVDTDFNGQNLSAAQPVVLDIGAFGGPAIGMIDIAGTLIPEPFTALTGAGNDVVTGSSGNDIITTNAGNDAITGGAGNDAINGGLGTDTVSYANAVSVTANATGFVVDAGAEGMDTLNGVEKLVFTVSDGMGGMIAKTFLLVGNGGYATIQAAVDAAVTGDETILVSGSYAESVTISSTKAGLTIEGLAGAQLTGGIFVQAGGVSISNLTIREGAVLGSQPGGVVVAASDVSLSDLTLSKSGTEGTLGGSTRGIVNAVGEGANLLISNVTVSGFATGVFLNPGADGAQIIDSTLSSNFVGLSNDDPDNFVITGTDFVDNAFEQIGLGVVDQVEDLSAVVGTGNTFTNSNAAVPNVSIYPLGATNAVQEIIGTGQADQFNGDQTNNGAAQRFEGGAGNDTINLGGGDDIAVGGEGDDTINGGAGQDTLTGGTGSDIFAFTAAGQTATIAATDNDANGAVSNGDTFTGNFDVITDFVSLDNDMIDLSAINNLATPSDVFADLQMNEFQFIKGDFDAGVFIANDAGADTLLAFDDGTNDVGVILLGVESLNENDDFIS